SQSPSPPVCPCCRYCSDSPTHAKAERGERDVRAQRHQSHARAEKDDEHDAEHPRHRGAVLRVRLPAVLKAGNKVVKPGRRHHLPPALLSGKVSVSVGGPLAPYTRRVARDGAGKGAEVGRVLRRGHGLRRGPHPRPPSRRATSGRIVYTAQWLSAARGGRR